MFRIVVDCVWYWSVVSVECICYGDGVFDDVNGIFHGDGLC